MTYPKKGTLNRLLFKSPLIWWRMGLGKILSHTALSGNKMLVLTSWGRKSLKPRHTMLSYALVGDREYVSSGWGARTDWYKNILEDPHVTVQVRGRVYSARAHRVQDIDEYTQIAQEMFATGGDTHFISWLESFGIEPNIQDVIDKRERLVLVAFDKSEEDGPPPMAIDLKWIWGVMLFVLVSIWLWVR
jgi:deazaflavin-dependent oxidoreductase (nitroreductase family)